MSIVTFINNGKEQTGKTLSAAAIATYMAIEHNCKILLVSTSNDGSTLSNCFFPKPKTIIQIKNKYTGKNNVGIDTMQTGMNGLIKMARANKITPETIKNYTKVVFKDAFEILLSGNEMGNDISSYYPDIIKMANQYYDYVFVDLDEDIDIPTKRIIINESNLIVYNITQRLLSIDNFIQEKARSQLLSSFKTILLVGRHDRFSKYTAKNISRYMGDKVPVLTIPYNTLYFEAAEEAGVPDFFINSRRKDKEDRNYGFMQEVGRVAQAIIFRLQELQIKS